MNCDVAIVGAGLAGLAAACALSASGHRVHVFDRRPYVGGRASSYLHPGTGEVVDNCQHVLLGCCTNLVGFYRQLGVEDRIRWYDRITFLEPGGRKSVLKPGILPAPLHNARAFLAAPSLSLRDKFAIARGMAAFLGSIPADSGENFAHWLRRHGQTRRAIDRFWNPVLVSALNDELDRVSVHYAAMVFRQAFMNSAEGGRMGVPTVPLSELYGHAARFIGSHGGVVDLRRNVQAVRREDANERWLVEIDGNAVDAAAVILAVPFESMERLVPGLPPKPEGAAEALAMKLAHFEHSPITGIHLWFDRPVTDLDHAVLLDATMQWMYNKSRLQPETRGDQSENYLELVVSASNSLVDKSRQEIVDLAIRELAEFFPVVREAKLTKAAVVKEVRATFSVQPGIDAFRPEAETPWPGLFLAGDWTNTGWPSTMEGAVRSGYRAAEAWMRAAGQPRMFSFPDLPAQGLMRWFGG